MLVFSNENRKGETLLWLKKLLPPFWFTSPHRILGQSLSMNFTCKMWMENEILLYANKKGLEGVIALTRTRLLIAQALNRHAGQEGPTCCRPGWTRLLAACNRLQNAPPAFIESARVPATRPSASRPTFLNTKNDQNIINYAWSWPVVLTLVAGTKGVYLFITLLNFFGF